MTTRLLGKKEVETQYKVKVMKLKAKGLTQRMDWIERTGKKEALRRYEATKTVCKARCTGGDDEAGAEAGLKEYNWWGRVVWCLERELRSFSW